VGPIVKSSRPVAIALLVALASSNAGATDVPTRAATSPALEEWSIERVERELPVPAGLPIEIENPLGDLRIRAGDDERVVVIAAVQRHRDDPAREHLTLEDGSGRIRVAAAFAPDEGGRSPAGSRRRIDLAVAVPPGARVVARTVDGLVEVKGHGGELEIETRSGAVRLWVAGSPRVRTDSGKIEVYLTAPGWSRAATLESSTGDVMLSFPPEAAADAILEGRGIFGTHFSLAVERVGPETRRGRARIGKGGSEVRLLSRTGELRLLEHMGPPR
jgi:hypothetical protein